MIRIKIIAAVITILLSLQLVAQKTASLNCKIGNAAPNDTLRLQVWPKVLSQRASLQLKHRTLIALNDNGSFHFNIDSLEGPVYVSLVKDRSTIIADSFAPFFDWYFIEPGDKISIRMDSAIAEKLTFPELGTTIAGYRFVNIKFEGKGSAKFEFLYSLVIKTNDWVMQHAISPTPFPKIDSVFFITIPERLRKACAHDQKFADFQFNVLKPYQAKVSPTAWQILKANLAGSIESIRLSTYTYHRSMYRRDTTVSANFKTALTNQLYQIYEERKKIDVADVSPAMLPYASHYVGYLSDKAYYIEKDQYLSLIKSYKEGLLRDKLITDLLLKRMFYLKNSNEAIRDAASIVADPYYSSIVVNIYNTQSIGTQAYNFSLPDSKGNTVQLSDFRGKIVFIDLWYTGCGACQSFYKRELSRVEKHYEENPNIVFVTISIDIDKARWLKSVNEGTYSSPNSPHVVNLYTDGQGSAHPLIKAYNVMGYPHPFMIDRNGKIYQINSLQAPAEELIPIIDEAIRKS